MKKLAAQLVIMTAIALAPIAAQAQQLKIGVVNAARLLEESSESKAALDKLESEFAGRERQLASEGNSLKRLGEKLSNDIATMGDEQQLRETRNFEEKQIQLARKAKQFQQDLARARQKELLKLQERMNVVINAVAREGRYDLILSEGVVFANERVDLTDLILARLNSGASKSYGR